MFDDLRDLVRADADRQIKRINVDVQFHRITAAAGRTQIAAVKTTMTDLLTFIDGLDV